MLAAVITLFATLELCPAGNGPARSVELHGGVSITGAGSNVHGDTTWYAWTGAQCTARIETQGALSVGADFQSIRPVRGGTFTIRVEYNGVREYRLSEQAEAFAVSGREVAIGADERTWIAEAMREYLRRAGLAPSQRASAAFRAGGTAALFAEARQIPRDDIRAAYLAVGLSETLPVEQRLAFVRDGSLMLGTGNALARFLMSVPAQWRGDEAMLQVIYEATATIEPDDEAVAVLRLTAVKHPTSPALANAIRRIISTLQATEMRRDLTAYYIGNP